MANPENNLTTSLDPWTITGFSNTESSFMITVYKENKRNIK